MPQASATTEELLDDIRELEQLDQLRSEFARWRKLAQAALNQFAEYSGDPKHPKEPAWRLKTDLEEKALVAKACCRPGGDTKLVKSLLATLRRRKIEDILGPAKDSPLFSKQNGKLTFLTAAYALDALATAPNAVFSPATVLYFYVVVRELYYPSAPAWMVGGARAGPGGSPTAFVTSQFVRAISSMARMLRRTGEYVSALAEMHQTVDTKAEEWNRFDAQRRALSLHTTLARRAWNLAFVIRNPVPPISAGVDRLRRFEAAIRHDLITALNASVRTFKKACASVKKYREAEKAAAARDAERLSLIELSEGAHGIAVRALEYASDRATRLRNMFPKRVPERNAVLSSKQRSVFAGQLKKVAEAFTETANGIQEIVNPAMDYLSNVLDNQLSRATGEAGGLAFEPFEMASAAATLGSVDKAWGNERLLRAAHFLGAAVTPEGFAIARPYHTGEGSYFQPSQPQILGAYAQIMEHVPADLSLSILQRLWRYFDKNRRPIDESRSSWKWDYAAPNWEHSPYHTALCAIALDRICRMLDRRINDRVLTHFNKTQPVEPLLQDLFYPDYGLAAVLESDKESKRIPIAVALERMRAHVAGVALDKPYKDRLYSAVLHGPPGTGKTTLMLALAASAGVRLVEVTPSDIVFGGAEAVERRADAVLRALSFLTDTVVLFDEFDPVLQTREGQQGPQSIFTFLTTSMLPKLKRLYDSAKDRRVAFALATNVIRKLDPAAIRGGRFDAAIGVYPPDLLSRYGRLYTEVRRYCNETQPSLPDFINERFEEIVLKSYGTSMPQVGKRGWFTRPDGEPQENSIFGYLFLSGAELPKFVRAEEEQQRDDDRGPKTNGREDPWSPTERKERTMIQELEDAQTLLGASIRKHIGAGCRR